VKEPQLVVARSPVAVLELLRVKRLAITDADGASSAGSNGGLGYSVAAGGACC